MIFLGIDIGSTHIKAGLFTEDGVCHAVTSRENISHRGADGGFYYDPEKIYQAVSSAVSELVLDTDPNLVAAIGIASMAETGLLVDKKTGLTRCPFIPWFDTTASSELDLITASIDPLEQFIKTGIRPSFKCALAKILWLKSQDESLLDNTVWMGVADYLAHRMTGAVSTDYSLAGRTYSFRIDEKVWDQGILEKHGLDISLFPSVKPSGSIVGYLHEKSAPDLKLKTGIPVSIAGHDHVCAAFGVRMVIGDIGSEFIVDSMGTAEALIGSISQRRLKEEEHNSGFAFGSDVIPGRLYWMGGLSASGGSVEWVRRLIGNPQLSYEEMQEQIKAAGEEPTGILYFPYLAGSGSPHSDASVRAAFVGFRNSHGRAEMIKAVFEGTAFEMEFIRRRAKMGLGLSADKIAVVGGGTHNLQWLQIKADVSGCPLEIPKIKNATLLGAALLAGIGSGYYTDVVEVSKKVMINNRVTGFCVSPDINRHKVYSHLYKKGYLAFQEGLRRVSSNIGISENR